MKKEEIKALIEKLTYSPKLIWDEIKISEKKATGKLAEEYKTFLDACKTEREAVREIVSQVTAKGFVEISQPKKKPAKRPAKVYTEFMDKTIGLAVFGKRPVSEGLRIIVSHIDAPRLDLKPNPIYEDAELAMLKTHYYGGIKKYQWLARPLALHGRIIKNNGKTIDIIFGEDINDPVLTIADLLPHLAANVQAGKKVSDAFPGEKLNLLTGSLPLGSGDTKERFKLAILQLMNKKWGITEEDFLSAEIEVVPAGPARDVGLDASMVGAYGQDDRSSAFTSLSAILDGGNTPEYTSVALFMDKEETGSDGATGAKSKFFQSFVADLLLVSGEKPDSRTLRQSLMASKALSADASAAINPDFQEVYEKRNAARMGYGPCISKYGGSRGKYGSSDASAEYLGWLRKAFNKAGIIWQTGEIGKVDEGGGGTVAMFLAQHGMDIVDCGAPLMGMHSPMEISSKADIYMTKKAFKVFYQAV